MDLLIELKGGHVFMNDIIISNRHINSPFTLVSFHTTNNNNNIKTCNYLNLNLFPLISTHCWYTVHIHFFIFGISLTVTQQKDAIHCKRMYVNVNTFTPAITITEFHCYNVKSKYEYFSQVFIRFGSIFNELQLHWVYLFSYNFSFIIRINK